MPLPDKELQVGGGCNCGAVRYRLDVPAVDERPLHPLAPPAAPVRLPFLVVDHCNDCRRATGALLPVWICAPIAIASVALVRASTATQAPQAAQRPHQDDEPRGAWTPAADAFVPASADADHFLRSYESSHQRWRWFCARCGTSLAYTAVMPAGFPEMLDVTMGSVDRQHLEGDALAPERHLWWDYGIDWIRQLATKGLGALPIHPDYRVADRVNI